MHNMKLWQKTAVLLILPLILVVVVVSQIPVRENELKALYQADRECSEATVLLYQISKVSIDAIREVIYFETTGHVAKHKLRFDQKLEQIKIMKSKLARRQGVSTRKLDTFLDQLATELNHVGEASGDGYVDSNRIAAVMRFSGLTRKLTSISDGMLAEQEKVARTASEQLEKKKNEFDAYVQLGGTASLAFAVLMSIFFNLDLLKQVAVLMSNASRFGRGEALLPQMRGANEMAHLDEMFHSMARSIDALNEREKAIFRNTNDLIFVVDDNFRLVFANEASTTLLGKEPADLLQTPVAELSSDLREQLEHARDQENYRFETNLKGTKGFVAEVEVSVHWSAGDRNFYCVAHDIGARKELERMKQSFLAMVTHDLRSPIAANQVALELLLTEKNMATLTPEGERLIRRILSSDHRLMRMINDLLDMEKLNAGLLSLDVELVSFNDIVEESMASVEPLLGAKNIEIHKDDSDKLILCDSSRIVQVVVNIISNAIKVSKSGQSIEVKFTEDDENSIIAIEDHGPGIPDEFLPVLFDQYTQTGDKAVAKQGSGLGLAISKKLIDLHDGDIVVTTILGEGTTFEIHLPKKAARRAT